MKTVSLAVALLTYLLSSSAFAEGNHFSHAVDSFERGGLIEEANLESMMSGDFYCVSYHYEGSVSPFRTEMRANPIAISDVENLYQLLETESDRWIVNFSASHTPYISSPPVYRVDLSKNILVRDRPMFRNDQSIVSLRFLEIDSRISIVTEVANPRRDISSDVPDSLIHEGYTAAFYQICDPRD